MKNAKSFFAVILIILSINSSIRACDICGCGLGNYYFGLVPQFGKGFFGVRYHFMRFHTQIFNDNTQYSNDYFQTIELWGGFNIGKRLGILAFVPYSFNRQVSDDGIKKDNGIGDIALLINYNVLEKSSLNRNNKLIYQELKIGVGVKMPTGKSDIDPTATDIIALANSQLGSGSTDFILNAGYTIRLDKLGFTTNLNYKMNAKSKEDYQFGNRFSSNNLLFYSLRSKNITYTPNAGILYENAASNKLKALKVDQTGGYATLAVIGLEMNIKNVSIGFNFQAPVAENYASGQTTTKLRALSHVTLAF
jgi:hypothetical protein